MKALTKSIVCLVILGFTFSSAHGQFAEPGDAVEYRKAVMFMIGQHFKRMGAMVKGEAPYDQAAFAQNAELLETLATLPWQASLEPGTDKGDTTLNSAVFEKQEEFLKAAQSFEQETAGLAQLAPEGLEGSKAQFSTVAASCKSCHSQFRTK
jgi:cytochrome c556